MSSYVVDNACGTGSAQEFGCAGLERLQNISVNRLSPMAKACSPLPARLAAVNRVGGCNKKRGTGKGLFPLVCSSHCDISYSFYNNCMVVSVFSLLYWSYLLIIFV